MSLIDPDLPGIRLLREQVARARELGLMTRDVGRAEVPEAPGPARRASMTPRAPETPWEWLAERQIASLCAYGVRIGVTVSLWEAAFAAWDDLWASSR